MPRVFVLVQLKYERIYKLIEPPFCDIFVLQMFATGALASIKR